MNRLDFLRRTNLFALAGVLILGSASSFADDTEIFFGTPRDSDQSRPNVFFLLDNSGSMAWRLDSDSTRLNGTDSRMTVLKNAFHDIVGSAQGINVGVMAFNERADFGGGRMVSAVSFIDEPVGIAVASPEILTSGDDASRYGTTTDITAPTLVMGYVSNHPNNTVSRSLNVNDPYSSDYSTFYLNGNISCSARISTARDNCATGIVEQLSASTSVQGRTGLFLFRNMNIPANATITSATLTLTPKNTQATKPTLELGTESSKAPPAFNDGTSISDRTFTYTTISGNTKLPNTWTQNQPFNIDVTAELNSLKALAPSADPVADIALRLRGTSNVNYSYSVGGDDSPRLTVTYSAVTQQARSTGLRFQNVAVPQGATIRSARIDFVPASSDDRDLTLEVRAQSSTDAAAFTTGEDFTARGKTAALTTWQPVPWRTENPPTYVEGPAVRAQVQEIVSNGGWCGNNAMAFFLQPSAGSGSRTAISFDGSSSLKPILRIDYEGGDGGCLNPEFETRITNAKNDARQNSESVSLTTASMTLSDNAHRVAARYENMPVRRNATVLDAEVIITRSDQSTSTGTVSIGVEAANNSAELQATRNNISDRTTLGSLQSCSLAGSQTICKGANLTAALNSLFARSGWSDGNALTLVIRRTAGSFNVASYEQNPGDSIKLRLRLAHGGMGENLRTVRQHVDGLVNNMNASGGTPIVPAMYEAARYLSDRYHQGRAPSPITSSCQATHLVVLTDGKPEGRDDNVNREIASLAGSCANSTIPDARCGVELANWLATTDQSSLAGESYINTHTVGFALNARPGDEGRNIREFLSAVATAGGGNSYTADNVSELTRAFNEILQQVLATDTTFVSATAPINSFNRQDHKDQLYFSLFRPSNTDRWAGNLKRYRMATNGSNAWIVDADNMAAIDPLTGFFKTNARSWWSETNDGNNVAAGGAASKLVNPATRNMLTNNGNNLMALNTTNVTATMLDASANEQPLLVSYIRGFDTTDTSVSRRAMGDPIHSTPTVVTYACSALNNLGECTNETQSAIIGTNEGLVQMFDTNTGAEQFSFMPRELLPNIKRLRANAATGNQGHIYGLDNNVTVWVNDKNDNGAVDGSDTVYAYATMGRGGRSIYALNITNPTAPTILWTITGGPNGTTGFSRLGQTWSAPVKTKIDVNGTVTDVLIFGGGYDPDQDNHNVRTVDDQGNDLYIVNARTGALLWSASAAGINMNYSVPSRVRAIGLETSPAGSPIINQQGLSTQIFVGDMGGQVWRFLVNNGSTGNNLVSGQIMADVGGSGVTSARRFYNEPEVSLITVNNAPRLSVTIGSGYRGHPLNTAIEDRFYAFHTDVLNGVAPIKRENSLVDITSNTSLTDDQAQEVLENGWMLRLTGTGEKVLSRPMAIAGDLYFNTYEPTATNNGCTASVGISRAYRVSLNDGSPIAQSRFVVLKGTTLPSNPQIFCQGDTCYAYNDQSQLTEIKQPCPAGQTCIDRATPYNMADVARMYWTDESAE